MTLRFTAGSALRTGMLMLCLAASASAQTAGTKLGPRPIQPPSSAASARLSIVELTKQADVIVIGKITEFRSEWNKARTRVYPRAILTAGEYLKASQTSPTLGITYPESGPDLVRFQKDEEVMVFLRKDPDGNLQVVGGSQGRYAVTKDIRTARKMVSAYTTLDEMKIEVTAAIRSGAAR